MITKDQTTVAARMGRRAATRFVSAGVPSPNPFTGEDPNSVALAKAWRDAYFDGQRSR